MPETRVYWGSTGTGKSYRCLQEGIDWADVVPYYMPILQEGGPVWTDGYLGDRAVIFEDFDGSQVPYRTLLRLLDRYPVKPPYKGGYNNWCPQLILINSNLHPQMWYPKEVWACGPLERRLTRLPSKIITMNDVVVFGPQLEYTD